MVQAPQQHIVDTPHSEDSSPSIAIVGMGPRGISVLERIAARLDNSTPPLTIHLIDDAQRGAGRIWDTEQTLTLCMNTRAGAVTLFTEPGSTVSAPILEGPIQYEWIQLIRGEREGIDHAKVALFDAYPVRPELMERYKEEIARTRPESNPTRALYGEYLRWVFDLVLDHLPGTVTVVSHQARVTEIVATEDNTQDILSLTDGTQITSDATVLAPGWQTPAPNEEEIRFAESGLRWISPNNPLEQNYQDIPAGEEVLVRGLGMGFFDIMALTTIERGGSFIADPAAPGGLRYEATGQEPHFIVSSGRGFPYYPKSEYGQLPPTMPLHRLKAVISQLTSEEHQDRSIDFEVEVFPAIIRDAYEAYITTLNKVRPEALYEPLETIINALDSTDPNQLPALTQTMTAEPWDLFSLMDPLNGFEGTAEELTAYIAQELDVQIAQSRQGSNSPVKAALWSLSESRKPSSILGSPGRYTPESRAGCYARIMSFGQMIGSGPPLFRSQELRALIEAGLVTFLGDRPIITIENNQWRMSSGDRSATASTLVDAWMHRPDIRRPSDPLLQSLLDQGRIRPFQDHGRATGSPEVDATTRKLVMVNGEQDPRVLLIGIPTYAQMPDTTISPMPGTDPLMLQETDKAAATLLRTILQ